MGKKAIFQTGGTVLLGFNVAIPMFLNAQGLFPNWPYQYHELFGFMAFAFFVGWIIFSKQSQINKYESGRPNMVLGNRAEAETLDNTQDSKMEVKFRLLYRNTGKKQAHQLRFRVGFAPVQRPHDFTWMSDYTSANPIDPDSDTEHGRNITLIQPYGKGGKDGILNRGLLIYCVVEYSDLGKGGKQYKDERWLFYRLFGDLAHATMEQKEALLPYVSSAPQITQIEREPTQ